MRVSVDVVVVTVFDNNLKVLLVNRQEDPYKGMLALPGVKVKEEESLEAAARRALREEAMISQMIPIEQVHSYGDDLERDPRNRVVSVVYMALLNYEPPYGMGERVLRVGFYDYDGIFDSEFAFDHKRILMDARERLRENVKDLDIAYELAGEEFTLPALQKVFELLRGETEYKANFRRKVKEDIEETGRVTSGDGHKPSKYYRRKPDMREEVLIRFFDQEQYAKCFLNGDIYMNDLAKFWGPNLDALKEEKKREGWETKEITPSKFGRDDDHEGVIAVQYKEDNPIARQLGIENVLGNVAYRIEEFGKCNLLCLYAMDIDHDEKKIYLPDDKRMKEHFGNYAVIIKDKQAFIDRMLAPLRGDDYYLYGRVDYIDLLGDDSITKRHHAAMQSNCSDTAFAPFIEKAFADGTAKTVDVFEKNMLLKYQREWRFCFYFHDARREARLHKIKKLDDIAEIVNVGDLITKIRQLYPEYRYALMKPGKSGIKGNINREEFVRKLYTKDQKVRVLFQIG